MIRSSWSDISSGERCKVGLLLRQVVRGLEIAVGWRQRTEAVGTQARWLARS